MAVMFWLIFRSGNYLAQLNLMQGIFTDREFFAYCLYRRDEKNPKREFMPCPAAGSPRRKLLAMTNWRQAPRDDGQVSLHPTSSSYA